MHPPARTWVRLLALALVLPAAAQASTFPDLGAVATAGAGFSLACDPSHLTAAEGGRATAQCTVTSLDGWGGSVSMSCGGQPAATYCSFSPSSFTLQPGRSQATAFTMAVFFGTPRTTHDFQVQARATGASANFPMQLEVPVAGAVVSCAPTALTAAVGGSAQSTCTLQSIGGFSGSVSLSCSGLPGGASCAFTPGSPQVPAGGSATSALTVSVPFGSPGQWDFTITSQTWGLHYSTQPMTLVVPFSGFDLACAPDALTAPAGGSARTTCTATSVNGWAGSISFYCSNPPPGGSCSFSHSFLTLRSGGTATTDMTVSTFPGTARGTYPFQVRGSGGSATASEGLTLTVT